MWTMDSRRCTLATPWRQSVVYHLMGDYALLCWDNRLPGAKDMFWVRGEHSVFPGLWSGTLSPSHCELSIPSQLVVASCHFLSDSLYVSKRGAYWDRLCRDVVGRWLVGWLSRACTVAKRCILGLYSYYGTLIGNPTPGIQWYNFRPPGVTPNQGMGPPWGAFCQITLTSC